ncbi:MAG TPA: dTMP kinase [Synechococcus sp. M44_DOE_062]|nr:dTMP kinase [Synechococcus sp. M44_DOE_062]
MFITLEGGEGVGKTTQQPLLAEQLRQEGYACLCTREPGGTALGKTLRDLLLHGDPFTPLAELLLYAADRAEHVSKVIGPALAAGQVVVCDRFTDSTLAYQGYGRGIDLDLIRQLNRWVTGGLQPDLTLWLDLPPEVGLGRARSRSSGVVELAVQSTNEQEDLEFHRRVYCGFETLAAAEPQRIVRVSAQGSPAEVAARIWLVVKPRLAHRNTIANVD